MATTLYSRGLQFYTFFGISIGITRRMIDIGKKIAFYFLQNVWKYTVFSHSHFKLAKSAILTQKNFFLKISIWVSKKSRILCWFQICWCRLSEMHLTKVKSKKPQKKCTKTKVLKIRIVFLALAFVRGICLSRHQGIWNQHKILRFLDTYIDIFKEKYFWVIIALFAILKCECEKNCTFSNILQKVKTYFFANIYHSPCDSHKVWNIEGPYCTVISWILRVRQMKRFTYRTST